MVDIRTLWNNGMFQSLHNNSKLVYIYLATSPSLNTVGVVCLNPEAASHLLNISLNDFREATKELVEKKYVFVKSVEGLIYFVVPKHFSTLAVNDNVIEKIKSDIASLPKEFKLYLNDLGISAEKKYKKFLKPTLQEIEDVAMGFGYSIDAKTFFEYYDNISKEQGKQVFWVDSNGTQIKDWKMKLKRVWCKPHNKLQKKDDAPKGYEFFYVMIDGKTYFPDSWKDGEPKSKDFTVNRALQKKFNEIKKK